MGNTMTTTFENTNIDFQDMNYAIDKGFILITTLDANESQNLIKNTISPSCEEEKINSLIENNDLSSYIIIYGRNSNDSKIYNKYRELKNFGFDKVFIYIGGMFEWALLQDIYGEDNFPTTSKELDILKFKPLSILNNFNLIQ